MEIIELKITKKQFAYINRMMYNTEVKNKYIRDNIICNKYLLAPDVYFSTYCDSLNYYLFFEGEEIPSGKYKIFDVTKIIPNE